MRISYWIMNDILIKNDIVGSTTKQEVQRRWGMSRFEAHQETFEYDIEFISEKHEMLFILQFGDQLKRDHTWKLQVPPL